MENPQINPSVKKEYRDDPFHQVGFQHWIIWGSQSSFFGYVYKFYRGEKKKALHSIKVIFL